MKAATVDHEDSFLILGGRDYDGDTYSDKIYKYVKDGGQWVELPTRMSEGKRSLAAVKVKSSLFKSCRG